MIDRDAALRIAERECPEGCAVTTEGARECKEGWFFAYNYSVPPNTVVVGGSSGVIVNRATGRTFELGTGYPVERDLHFYDLGYQSARADIIILAVRNRRRTLRTLLDVGVTVIEPEYESGTVWRTPRRLSRSELRSRLRQLPAVLPDQSIYFRFEVLEEARENRWFDFKLHERSISRDRRGDGADVT